MMLTTERLLLREFEESDWSAVLAYQSDPQYLRFTPWEQRTEADVREFIQMFINWRTETPRKRFQFAAILQANGRFIGNCGIRVNQAKSWEADIGYEFDSQYWGRGYATEAAQALLTLGFRDLRLHRVWAQCIADNVDSARVLEKIGMRREGRSRESEWMKGRWWDMLSYSLLDREWRARN